jgi:hypothetical protein
MQDSKPAGSASSWPEGIGTTTADGKPATVMAKYVE